MRCSTCESRRHTHAHATPSLRHALAAPSRLGRCLTETLFQRVGGDGDRTITFNDIAAAANLPADQVELLVMRALSLKLIRGVLDQVDGTLRVTWVQPRVLQTAQINLMKERLTTWCGTVDKTLAFLETETPEFST